MWGRAQHGAVEILGGPHEGKVGLYDDDCALGAIVYFDGHYKNEFYEIIPHHYLRNTTLIYQTSYH